MNKRDYLGRYAEGWNKGDASIILESVADSFQFDDPNAGSISKNGIPDYLAGLKQEAQNIRSEAADGFMELTEVVTQEEGDVLTAWCWWSISGTPIQGSGLIKIEDGGVVSERITYYTKLPVI